MQLNSAELISLRERLKARRRKGAPMLPRRIPASISAARVLGTAPVLLSMFALFLLMHTLERTVHALTVRVADLTVRAYAALLPEMIEEELEKFEP